MSIVKQVKALGARATMGDDDVRALLVNDHDEAREYAAQMCDGKQARQRMAALARLRPALTAHSRAEERVVYAALLSVRANAEARILSHEGFVEHGIVDELLAKLASTDAGTELWAAHAKVCKELLEHHIDEEQSSIFADLGDNFSRDQLALMGERFLQEKAAVMRALAAGEDAPARAPRKRRSKAAARKPAVKSKARSRRAAPARPARKAATRKQAARKRH